MPDDMHIFSSPLLAEAVNAELAYLRRLGVSDKLVSACSNLGAYQALLIIMQNKEIGVPVYNVVANASSPFAGQSALLNHLRSLKRLGLLEERQGVKKSQVCLAPTDSLLQELGPILCERHLGRTRE
jgi:hypothetical protein